MDNYEDLHEGIEEFKKLCEKHNYDKKLDLYAQLEISINIIYFLLYLLFFS